MLFDTIIVSYHSAVAVDRRFRRSLWQLALWRQWFDCRQLTPSVACQKQSILKMLRRPLNLSSLLTSRRC